MDATPAVDQPETSLPARVSAGTWDDPRPGQAQALADYARMLRENPHLFDPRPWRQVLDDVFGPLESE